MVNWLRIWWLKCWDALGPPRKLLVAEGDSVPQRLPWRDLVLAREDGDDWAIGFCCPCGCQRHIELLVIAEARPRWDYHVDERNIPSLSPSVSLRDGCKSHFWVRGGRIHWAKGD